LVSKRAYLVVFVLISLVATGTATTKRRHHARRAALRAQTGRRVALRHLRRVVWHPMFPGSHEMLVRQNVQLDMLELPRIANDEELEIRELNQELVPVADSPALTVASNLQENRRYCRPWTRQFLQELGEAYYNEFHQPIVATSLVRTAEQQKKLRRHNRNAAPQEGDTASTHLAGVTVDILKRGMTRKQHDWVNHYLLPLQQAGLVDPIEERRQPVFHIVVFNNYGQPKEPEPGPTYVDDAPEPPNLQTLLGSN
jgi:hypothetical protein